MLAQRLLEAPGGDGVQEADLSLVTRAKRGDLEALGNLYDLNYDGIYRYVLSRVGDRHVAEDLTADVFARMLTALPGYRSIGVPFRSWLYQIARNLVVDHHRRDNRRTLTELDQVAEHPDSRDLAAEVELSLTYERVHGALERLEDTQKEVVALRFLSGLSLKEVARALNKTVAATKSIQHRGLTALRTELAGEA